MESKDKQIEALVVLLEEAELEKDDRMKQTCDIHQGKKMSEVRSGYSVSTL